MVSEQKDADNSANYQKKKSAETLPMQKANGNTSETQVGQTSTEASPSLGSPNGVLNRMLNASAGIISQNEKNVNSKNNVEQSRIF